MKNTLFLLVLDGIAVGVQSSTLLHILPSNKFNIINSLALFGWALGTLASGYISARLTDLINYKSCGMIQIVIFLCACSSSFIAYEFKVMGLSFFAIFLWGFFTFSVEGFMTVILCKVYKSIVEGYIINRQVRCLSETLYSTLNSMTNNKIPVSLLMVGISIFSIPALIWLIFWKVDEESSDLMSESD